MQKDSHAALSNYFGETISGNLTTQISDHLPQFLIIKDNPVFHKKNIKLTKRDFANFDEDAFLYETENINWDQVINNADVNMAYNNFFQTITSKIDKFAPLKYLTKKEIKKQQKPWISKNILDLIK